MHPRPALRRWLDACGFAALLLVLLWLLAWVTGAQLEAAAREQAVGHARGDSLFHWNFSEAEALVGPVLGAETLDRENREAGTLQLRLLRGDANLGLRLSGQRIDPSALPRLQLRLQSDTPLQWRLAAASDLRPDLPAGPWMPWPPAAREHTDRTEAKAAASASFEAELAPLLPPLDGHIAQLRLQLLGAPGQIVGLQSLSLHPVCAEDACLPPHQQLSHRLLPSQLLAARDAGLLASPQARIGAEAPEWLVHGVLAMRALTLTQAAGIALLLVLASALSARARRPGLRRGFALLVGAGLPLLLLALGVPRFPPQAADAVLILGWALALFWLRPRADQWEPAATPIELRDSVLIGSARAWRSATVVSAAGLALLVLLSLIGGGPEPGGVDPERVGRYLAWAALQQAWLAVFLIPHLRGSSHAGQTAVLAGLLFAALHLPNAELMALCLLGGWAWARIALKHGSLLPQIASHAALGLAASALLPSSVLRSLEVGGRYVFAPL